MINTCIFKGGGAAWLAKEVKVDQRPCVRKPDYLIESSCPLLSLPLTLTWQQPEIWGLSRPLSWERGTGQHTYTLKSFCFCSLSHSHSLSQTYKEERKPFVYAHSLIQPQIEIFVSYIHSLFHPHKTIKLSHAWFLFIVCLLNCFISCFSQFGTICLSIFLFLQLPFFPILSCQQHCACSFCEPGLPRHCLRVLFFPYALVSTFHHRISGISLSPSLCFSAVFKLWLSWERHSAP